MEDFIMEKSPGKKLRDMIAKGRIVQTMASHSPLSARLAEEAGFDAIWASGFELSALHGLADVSLITMTQHLESTRAIVSTVHQPVVADIDTGFGNAVNVIHCVRHYEQAGVAALVIEDKTFPKFTSLAAGARQELVSIDCFQGKIGAVAATRKDPDLVIIARTEALIAGLGQSEALRRADAYVEAGADMILIHSRQPEPSEVEAFVQSWSRDIPLVIVPTAYPTLNRQRARELGKIGMIIYGNHAVRAAVTGMQKVFARIIKDGGIQEVNKDIVPVEEIFRLQDMTMVKVWEGLFLR